MDFLGGCFRHLRIIVPTQPIKNNPRVLAPQGHQGNNSMWQVKHFRSFALRKLRVLAEVCHLVVAFLCRLRTVRVTVVSSALLPPAHLFIFILTSLRWPLTPAEPGFASLAGCHSRVCETPVRACSWESKPGSLWSGTLCQAYATGTVHSFIQLPSAGFPPSLFRGRGSESLPLQALTIQSHPSPQTAW